MTQEKRYRWALRLLIPLFLTSGATSLVYETLWERQLHLVVGTSQVAVIVVLTAFMAGLALGGFLSARMAHRVRNPLLAYALLEGVIGLYAIAFPWILEAIQPIYLSFWTYAEPGPIGFAVFQFFLTGIFVLPPTICMGATLPILTRFATQTMEDSGAQVGRLYGANTIGAVLGVAIAGFYLLPNIGLQATTWHTASANLLLCVVAGAMGLSIKGRPEVTEAIEDQPGMPEQSIDHDWLKSLYWVAGLGGLSSLIFEVSWFRLLTLIFGASAYAFSLMLLAFLMGIGTGGWAGGRLADRVWRRGGRPAIMRMAGRIQLGIAIVAYLSMYAYMALPGSFVLVYQWVNGAEHYNLLWLANLGLALLLMLPPAFLMGVMFPLLVKGAADGTHEMGGPVGRVYGWNTVGAIFGASIGGLALLPLIDVRGAILVAITVNMLAALLAWRAQEAQRSEAQQDPLRLRRLTTIMVASIGLVHIASTIDIESVGGDQSKEFPYWDPLLITAGTYKYVDYIPEERRNLIDVWGAVWGLSVVHWELLYYEEGLSTVVTVAEDKGNGNIWLANNGKVDASTVMDMPTQVLVGHLPFVFRPHAEDVLVIGLASGITAGAVTSHCSPDESGSCRVGRKSIEIIEIEPTIEEASRFFDEHNNRPLEDPRVEFFIEDGRNHVLRQPDGRYDIIVSEPPNPWLSGVANLFTREFFALGKSKLKESGVWTQWVQMYGMAPYDLRSLLRTFAESYDHVLLFSTIEDSDLVMVGSDGPLDLSVDAIGEMMNLDPAVLADLTRIEIPEPEDLIVRFTLDRDKMLRMAGDAELNTDDNMRIEYSAPKHLYLDSVGDNYDLLLDENWETGWVPTDVVTDLDQRIYLVGAMIRHGRNLREALQVLDIIHEQVFESRSAHPSGHSSAPREDLREVSLRKIILAIQADSLVWGPDNDSYSTVDLEREFRLLGDLKLDLAIAEGLQYWSCSHWSSSTVAMDENAKLASNYLDLMEEALNFIVASESDFPGDDRQRERAVGLASTVQAEREFRQGESRGSLLCINF
jgi:spermidine synthase